MAGALPDTPAARVDPNTASSPYAGVAAIIINGATYSGVVVASQYVLTAAHVASGVAPQNIQVALNLGASQQWTSGVDSVTVFPTYSFPYDDLAILKLSTSIPCGVPVYPMYTGSEATGLTLILVGYGSSGNGDVGVTVGGASTVKRTGENAYDLYFTSFNDGTGKTSVFYMYDFDGPTGNGPLGGPTLGNALETMVAVGDSGSPAFVRVDGALQLFGINNFVTTAVQGQSVNYEFGDLGGGIIAADSKFAAFLQSATNGTLGQPAVCMPESGDGPMPSWATLVLGICLAGLALSRGAGAARNRTP